MAFLEAFMCYSLVDETDTFTEGEALQPLSALGDENFLDGSTHVLTHFALDNFIGEGIVITLAHEIDGSFRDGLVVLGDEHDCSFV